MDKPDEMTIRDAIAIAVLPIFLPGQDHHKFRIQANLAYRFADVMLEAREMTPDDLKPFFQEVE